MHKRRNGAAHPAPITIEPLERRTLLSAVLPSGAVAAALATATSPGNSPAAIRKAYGFDQIRFSNDTIAGDGAGQTIAIVNPYDDPNVAADLATFDQQFAIPDPPLFTKVDQGGGQNFPPASTRWAGETALDVEWAHAIAPGADIVLVEANSPNVNDLIQAVDTARHLAGVSVVSMSWGAPEFASERLLDALFTTPADHSGVTFVAAAGDLASGDPTQWPAISANVLSVGGTSLSSDSTSGAYVSESVWAGSAGGTSTYEPEGAAQFPAQQTGARTTPDVSYNADPASGYAVYNSVPYQGRTGWQVVGGTSAGAPQWAALIAIADQGRQLNGMAALDGSTGTLPLLYQLGSINFNPIPATSGVSGAYNSASGLGSPRAAQLTTALSDAAPPPAPQLSSVTATDASATSPAPPVVSDPKKDKQGQAVTPAALPYVRPPTAAAWPPPPAFGPSPSAVYVRSAIQMSDLATVKQGAAPAIARSAAAPRSAVLFIAAAPAANAAAQAMTFVHEGDGAFHWVAGIGASVCQWAWAGGAAGEHLASVAQGATLPASIGLPIVYHFATVDVPRTFSDALGAFISDSAQSAGSARLPASHARAWAITLAVLGADAVVLRLALVRRDRKKNAIVLTSRLTPARSRIRVRAVRAAV